LVKGDDEVLFEGVLIGATLSPALSLKGEGAIGAG